MPRAAKSELSAAEARRITLRAQGFGAGPLDVVGTRAIMRVFERLGCLQMDAVNILVRAHYVPIFSRLGAYDPVRLERLVWEHRSRKLFEYWGHEASLIPLTLYPLFRWRMERARRGLGTWRRIAAIAVGQPALVAAVFREVSERGPLASSQIADHRRTGSWWGWSDVKVALEYLFWSGALTTAERRNFERLYDLPERVFHPGVLAQPTPSEADAQRELLRLASRALGIATGSDLRDYFRLGVDANTHIADLVEAGDLLAVQVDGWKSMAYLAPAVTLPRSMDARTLLSPFDPLVWKRDRVLRLFGFDYKIEIYTPAGQRRYGYYALPVLCGDRLVARVDLKAQRQTRSLNAISIHFEDINPTIDVRDSIRAALVDLARWLRLDKVAIGSCFSPQRMRYAANSDTMYLA